MNRWAGLCALCLFAGCGGPNGGTADAAVPDGATYDAAPSGPLGAWRILSATRTFDDGGTRTIGDTGKTRVNGTLEVTAGGEYAVAEKYLRDGGLVVDDGGPNAFLDNYTPPPGATFALTHFPPVPFSYTPAPSDSLTIHPDGAHSWLLRRLVPSATDTFAITGTVRLAAGAAMNCPRAALVFVVRSGNGLAYDIRDDQALTFNGSTATLGGSPLDRTMPPRGTERITWGTTAETAIGLVVVYDDSARPGVDAGTACQNGRLDISSLLNKCSVLTEDCVRGISEIVLTYRFGSAPTLATSPYAYTRPQWTQAKMVTDRRAGATKVGLVSLDPATPLPFNVEVPAAASGVFVPIFNLSQ